MKSFVAITAFCLIIFCPNQIKAQFDFGAHPSGIHWQSIDSDNVKVIFPKGKDKEAQRIAAIIDLMADKHSESIGPRRKKIDLVLQTNQVISNGYVALAPYRSEFFATPFQNSSLLGSVDWLDQLAIHEYRHAQQFINGRRGLTSVIGVMEGQKGWALAYSLSVPNWFSEGDAVMTETVLTDGGRGRTPSFYTTQRALLTNGINYSYMKARNGSYKDLLPNHYSLGYVMNNYVRNNYGENSWSKILVDATRYRSVIYPFSGALKRHTKLRSPKLYKKAYQELQEQWQTELQNLTLTQHTTLMQKSKNTVTNYRNAHYLNDGSVIAVKSSYKNTEALYRIKDGKEQKLTTIGVEPEGYMSENNNKIAWTEMKVNARRSNQSYTVIKTYDVDTHQKRTLTAKGKFFSPHFSGSGNKIVSVEANENLQYQLLVLDAKTGNITERIPNPENDFITLPKWTNDDQAIIYLVKKNSQLAFFRYDFLTRKSNQLSDWTTQTIENFNVGKDKIYYSASYSGIDNIYTLDLNGNGNSIQITSSKIGAYMPDISPDGNKIMMSEFTEMGNILTEIELSKSIQKPISVVHSWEMERYNIYLSDTEKNILENVPQKNYEIKDYRGIFRGTKLHSWSYTETASTQEINGQFNNILNDFSADLTVGYNRNENTALYDGTVSYGYLYPILNIGTQLQNRNTSYLTPTGLVKYAFEERIFTGGFTLPFSWINGNYYTDLNFNADYEKHFIQKSSIINGINTDFNVAKTSLSLSNTRRTAYQNVSYKSGQVLKIDYYKGINQTTAEKIGTTLSLYFPGIGANHSFKIEGAYQKELLSNTYQFSDTFRYARGYSTIYANDEVARLSFNYQLPLFYPDWGFAGLTYFKRLRANLFFDAMQLKINYASKILHQNSYGAEVIFDNTFFNLFPISIGVRNSWKMDAPTNIDPYTMELIFGIGF